MMVGFALADIIGKRDEITDDRYKINEGDYITKYTIMTIATMDWLMSDWHSSKRLNKMFYEYYINYPDKTDKVYGAGLHSWLEKGAQWYRTDYGASCAVWASVAGHKATNMRELKRLVKRITRCTHNTDTALQSSEIVSIVIYLCKKGFKKNKIIEYLHKNYNYTMCDNVEKEVKEHQFTSNAKVVTFLALDILFSSKQYSDACKLCGYLKENKQLISCLTGIMAEAYFNTPLFNNLEQFKSIFPKKYYTTLKEFKKYKFSANTNVK